MKVCSIEHMRVTGSSHQTGGTLLKRQDRYRALLCLSCALVHTHSPRKLDLGIIVQNTWKVPGEAGLVSSVWIKYPEKMLRGELGGKEQSPEVSFFFHSSLVSQATRGPNVEKGASWFSCYPDSTQVISQQMHQTL